MNELNHAAGHRTASDLLQPDNLATLSMNHRSAATGFEPLDNVLDGGFLPEELIVVGGRPGVGKTISLVQWARSQAKNGQHVMLANYEHSQLTMLTQLMLIEIGEVVTDIEVSTAAREAAADVVAGRCTWQEAASGNESLRMAHREVSKYASNLHFVHEANLRRGLTGLRNALDDRVDVDVLIVDHLAKVPTERAEGGRPGLVAEQLKSDAVQYGHVVIASATVSNAGIGSRRLRLNDLEDAALVGHEADVVLLLSNKMAAVSRNHSAFDSTRADSFRNHVIFTVEKNRRGLGGIDMEFRRDFAHRRFHPEGGFVAEMLVDDILVRD